LIVAKIIFYLAAFLLIYTYVLYPFILQCLSLFTGPKSIENFNDYDKDLPSLFVLMAAYNEEAIIQHKIDSIFLTNYPKNRIKVIIGSDGSTDKTDEIIEASIQKYKQIELIKLAGRSGKPEVINQLVNHYESNHKNSDSDIFIMTDANVIFEPDTLFELAKNFKNSKIGIVGAKVINKNVSEDDISFLEQMYVSKENQIKYNEGQLFGSMMGVFGGCYAIQSNLYKPVPSNFRVDDFYITMQVLLAGYQAIKENKALVYEDLPGNIEEEFRRKRRIGAGNFQNMFALKELLWPFSKTSFAYISHKAIRWFGPFLLMLTFITSWYLSKNGIIYFTFFVIQLAMIAMTIINQLWKSSKGKPTIVKYAGYFYYMNLALLFGFIDYLKGIKTNVWEPTKRNV